MLTPDSHKYLSPIFYSILIGFGYAINASVLWACIPYLIDPKVIDIAFGISSSVQNLCQSAFPLIIGLINQQTTKIMVIIG